MARFLQFFFNHSLTILLTTSYWNYNLSLIIKILSATEFVWLGLHSTYDY